MDKVLIVDDNRESVDNLKEGLEKMNQFEVVTAYDGEQAIEILEQERISLLVTDIKMPNVDGLELLAYMTKKHASTPCIVMTGHGTLEMRRLLDERGVLQYIEKPFDFRRLALAIIEGLHLLDEGKSMKGMVLRTFLPLVAFTKKSCRIEVTSAGKGKGYFYFDSGELREAHYKEMRGDLAAQEMLRWDTMEISFNDLPQGRAKGRMVKNLTELLGGGVTRSSEAFQSEVPPEPEQANPPEQPDSQLHVVTGAPNVEPPIKAAPSALGEAYESVLADHLEVIKRTKGYKGIALYNFAGELITSDTAEDGASLEEWGLRLTDLFRKAHEISTEENLGESIEMTLHTADMNVLICSPGLGSKVCFYIMGFLAANGNWYYMKMELSNATARIAAELS